MGASVYTAVATPELVGVLGWWAVVLCAPVLYPRRRRRRTERQRRAARDRELRGPLAPAAAAWPVVADRHLPMLVDLAPWDGSSPARVGARVSAETLEPLCRYIDFHRRLELAVSELEDKIRVLPRDRWRTERYPLTGDRSNTLLILGATGVFVISATYAPGGWDDGVTVNKLARKIQSLLPGYPGEVRAAICYPFSSLGPRIWHREGDNGAWVGVWILGGDSVLGWLEHFGEEAGLLPADLEYFDELSRPNWLKPAIPTPETWPPLPDPSWEE